MLHCFELVIAVCTAEMPNVMPFWVKFGSCLSLSPIHFWAFQGSLQILYNEFRSYYCHPLVQRYNLTFCSTRNSEIILYNKKVSAQAKQFLSGK